MAKSIMLFLVGGLFLSAGVGNIIKAFSERKLVFGLFPSVEMTVELAVYVVFIYFGSKLVRQGYEIRKEKLKI